MATALIAAGVSAAVLMFERRILAALDATPDPDTDEGLRFPAERTHVLAMPDGGQLHAEECGSGRPVVLLHGHGANLAIFASVAARLQASGQRVIGVDHRGFGRSSALPPGFGFSGLVDDLANVLEVLDLREAIVVGHSMGGTVALALAMQHPDVTAVRVAALVLVNSAARGPADRPLTRARAATLDWRVVERVGRHPRHGVVLTRANFGVDARKSHVVGVRRVGFASPAALRHGFTRRLLGIDLRDRLGDVDVPVLALAGAADRVLPPAESAQITNAVRGARLRVLAGAGHVLPVERSAEVAEEILRFAAEVDATAADASQPVSGCRSGARRIIGHR